MITLIDKTDEKVAAEQIWNNLDREVRELNHQFAEVLGRKVALKHFIKALY
ncbi:hypothetical protein [Shewanella sp. TC10]|uniref:hypothetical protein n=1 Tax=Shewanella sp. TC10 TaxID=1419739 RepID=UPI00129D9891|nr:hypothetical protein [Shewanella sp. TC10]